MDRIERERQFHNIAFTQRTRASVEKYYAVTGASRRHYLGRIAEAGRHRRVLEYGCATGSSALDLARMGSQVTGIDISDRAIELARAAARDAGVESSCRFEVMNAEELQFGEGTFDLVCGTGILHHLDLSRALSEIARVLAPGGVAVFTEPLGHNPLVNLFRRLTPTLRTRDEHPLLLSDLHSAGSHFLDVRASFYHLQTLLAVPFRRLRFFGGLVRALDASDTLVFRLLPSLQRHAWCAVIELSRPRGHAEVRSLKPLDTRQARPLEATRRRSG